ncbi:response regulator [Clostridium sp. MSJ-4]|uniref:Response regulator n=1 Tax=Clostridium simiarum TaxID=2841506 RepID=A0ABS6EYG4_9CLOT|nr:response regulator [Clostridium simiarum]MBU5590407.1 response regulator [Clostridium simiarum]
MKRVVILDSKHYIRYRVKELIEKDGMEVHEASNYSQLLTKLGELKNEVDLIIIDMNLKEEDGLEVIERIRRKNINIPFMVLTHLNTMDAFAKAVKVGAIDYFIKPFDENKFHDRVTRHARGDLAIQPPRVNRKSKISFNDYLQSQVQKSKDGKYPLSIIMTVFFKSLKDLTMDINNDNMLIEDYVHGKLKGILPEAQYFEKHGFRTFVGVYPDFDKESITELSREMIHKIKKMKEKDSILKEYYFDNVHISFPLEGKDKDEIMENLTAKMEEALKQKQKETAS